MRVERTSHGEDRRRFVYAIVAASIEGVVARGLPSPGLRHSNTDKRVEGIAYTTGYGVWGVSRIKATGPERGVLTHEIRVEARWGWETGCVWMGEVIMTGMARPII